jgi:hypothetical protein
MDAVVAVDICKLDMGSVWELYHQRENAHKRLRQLFEAGEVHDFVQLALGISDRAGNYSAAEDRMGPKILAAATERAVFNLAQAIERCPTVNDLPGVIYAAEIDTLKISIGSEIAMMLKPSRYWVGISARFGRKCWSGMG